jgi:hypothetical protein
MAKADPQKKLLTSKVLARQRLGNLQRARYLGISLKQLDTPFKLTPAVPKQGSARLGMSGVWRFDLERGPSTGQAYFRNGAGFPAPEVSIRFPRLKKGENYLVEFNVSIVRGRDFVFGVAGGGEGGQHSHDEDTSLPRGSVGNRSLLTLIEAEDEVPNPLYFSARIVAKGPQDGEWYFRSARVSVPR